MNEAITEQLKQRKESRISNNFSQDKNPKHQFLLSPSDLGVIRNGGRRGSQYAPTALLNSIKALPLKTSFKDQSFHSIEICSNRDMDFDQMQSSSIKKIADTLSSNSSRNIFHIGGGHDHIYPLVMALKDFGKKIHVINIDPHLDTRVDKSFHSGTPFRQLQNEIQNIRFTQIGTSKNANVDENYHQLDKLQVRIFDMDKLIKMTNHFSAIEQITIESIMDINQDEITILSLDCDVLPSSIMSAVSAVAGDTITVGFFNSLIDCYLKNVLDKRYFGIYEYNPVFEDLSNKGQKFIAATIYKFLI